MSSPARIKMDTLSENMIAYYPGETQLFDGEVSVSEFERDESVGPSSAYATVDGDRQLTLGLLKQVQHPIRTQYAGYFLNRVGDMLVCNVNLALRDQPSPELVTRALLAAMLPDLPRTS